VIPGETACRESRDIIERAHGSGMWGNRAFLAFARKVVYHKSNIAIPDVLCHTGASALKRSPEEIGFAMTPEGRLPPLQTFQNVRVHEITAYGPAHSTG